MGSFLPGESLLAATIKSQLRNNAIAIISLVVALSSFSYTAWRTERSERNRTTRQAAFQMLVALGEMKQVVYHGHYDHDAVRGNPRTGWVYVETIRDFSSAMPAPVPAKAWPRPWAKASIPLISSAWPKSRWSIRLMKRIPSHL